jgi:hypothetical protein
MGGGSMNPLSEQIFGEFLRLKEENERYHEALSSIEVIASDGSDCDVLSIMEIANQALRKP